MEIRLDPRLSPQENAAKYFKQYNKAKTAEKILTEQLRLGREELAYLESVLQQLQQAEAEQDFNDIRAELTDTMQADADGVWFDAEKIALPLHIRGRRDGDTIATRGAAGKKKLKKELIDCKIAVSERDKIPLVCDADDHILWVVGIRTANIATPNKETKQYLYLRREKEI